MIEVPAEIKEAITTFPEDRQEVALQLVRNQLAYFENCDKGVHMTWGHNGAKTWPDTFDLWGKNWVEKFLGALLTELKKLFLHDLIRFDVAAGPIHHMSYGRLVSATGVDSTISLKFEDIELRMQPRRTKTLLNSLDDLVCDSHGSKRQFIEEEMWPILMESTFEQYVREIFCDLKTAATANPIVETTKDGLLKEIERQTAVTHRRSGSGPANKIIGSGELVCDLPIEDPQWEEHSTGIFYAGRLNDRWEVYVDSFFPPDEVLLFRNAKPTGSAGFLAALFYFQLHGHLGGLVIRAGKHLVRPDFYTLLKVA